MRAAVITEPGPADAIQIIDVDTPTPGQGEIRVEVAAAGVNPVDLLTRAGLLHQFGMITRTGPVGLGRDIAGTVTAVGSPDTGFAVGDRVAAFIADVDRATSGYAEEAVVPAADAATIPDGLPLTDAATVPLNALTALQGIALLGPADGRTLLVTGAAGGVGGYAVAIAARHGWTVTGLARPDDKDFVLASGATDLITEPTGGYDAVFDAAHIPDTAITLVRDGGHYVGVRGFEVPERGNVRSEAVHAVPDGNALATLLADHADGALVARVHATLPLEQASIAHKALDAGGARGRYLLIP